MRPLKPAMFVSCSQCIHGREFRGSNGEIGHVGESDTLGSLRFTGSDCAVCGGSGFLGTVRIETLRVGARFIDSQGHTARVTRKDGLVYAADEQSGEAYAFIRRAAVRALERSSP